MWVKPNGPGNILNDWGCSSYGCHHDSWIDLISNTSTTGNLKIRVWSFTPLNLGTITYGTWNHIVLRYVYGGKLDGFLNGSKTASIGGTRSVNTGGLGYYNFIGAKTATNLGNGYYFNGYIAIYRQYARALPDSEILSNYNAEKAMFTN